MRLLLFAITLSALGAASYWVLTGGPLAPPPAEMVSADSLRAAAASLTPHGEEPVPSVPARPAAPARPAVEVQLTNASYAVTGTTAREVLYSLLESGPREGGEVFFGLTETELDVRYDPNEIAGGCMIEDTEVDLRVVVTLPEWLPVTDVDPDLHRDWARFRRALAAHENRHRAIALGGAEAAYRAVAGLYRPSCEEAITEARRRLERLGVEVSAAHRRYDTETEHGRSEGASWPVRR